MNIRIQKSFVMVAAIVVATMMLSLLVAHPEWAFAASDASMGSENNVASEPSVELAADESAASSTDASDAASGLEDNSVKLNNSQSAKKGKLPSDNSEQESKIESVSIESVSVKSPSLTVGDEQVVTVLLEGAADRITNARLTIQISDGTSKIIESTTIGNTEIKFSYKVDIPGDYSIKNLLVIFSDDTESNFEDINKKIESKGSYKVLAPASQSPKQSKALGDVLDENSGSSSAENIRSDSSSRKQYATSEGTFDTKVPNKLDANVSNGGSTLEMRKAAKAMAVAVASSKRAGDINGDGIITIVIDAGHGGKDSGALGSGSYSYLQEKNLTLKIAQYCKAYLEQYMGVRVYLTRDSDIYRGLHERSEIAQSLNADMLVSIHINSSPSASAHGVEVYYQTLTSDYNKDVAEQSYKAANEVNEQLKNLGLSSRGVKYRLSENGTRYSDGSLADYLSLIHNPRLMGIPSILIEHLFISNSADASKLSSNSWLEKLGNADAMGLVSLYSLNKGQWVYENGKWHWYENGNKVINAWRVIDGDKLYFGPDGVAVRGWQRIGTATYYFDKNSAALQVGWLEQSSKYYYLASSDGKLQTGSFMVGSQWYMADSAGAVKQGLQHVADGRTYYYEGKSVRKGWLDLGGKTYRLDRDDGHLWTGWYGVDDDVFYANGDGTIVKGWLDLGGKRYRLDRDDGHLWTGWYSVDAGNFYSNDAGVLQKGVFRASDSLYYADPSDGPIGKASGRVEWNGKFYFIEADSHVSTGKWVVLKDGTQSWADKKTGVLSASLRNGSFVDANGKALVGWQNLNGQWFYADAPNGAIHKGWAKIGGSWYYFKSDGTVTYGWAQIDGSWYYFKSDGTAAYGWQTINGNEFYFDSHARMVTGWQTINGKKYYFANNGRYQRYTDNMSIWAQNYSSATNWLIMVDLDSTNVGIYNGSYGNWRLQYFWKCCPGKPSTPTVRGTFKVLSKKPHLNSTPSAMYATNFYGNYYFHSILKSRSELGQHLSHGCVRMDWDTAYWIYKNIPLGTKVRVY